MFPVVAVIWLIFFASALQPYEKIITLLLIFLVLGGLAILPWLPVLFPREPLSSSPFEDL
ncbi:MAG: hypothetical protein ACFFCF_08660 [Promethearchaeota archaeon]